MDSFSEAVQWRRRCGPSRTSIFGEEPVIAPTLLLSLSEAGDRVRSIRGLLQPLWAGTLCALNGRFFYSRGLSAASAEAYKRRERASRIEMRAFICNFVL